MSPLRLAFVAFALLAAGGGLLWVMKGEPEAKPRPMTIDDVLREYGLEPASAASAPADGSMSSMQPAEERAKQDLLPKSAHPLWQVLNKSPISYSETEPHITISVTEAVKALEGKDMTISGFVLPMDEGQHTGITKHVLISQRTPTCTFHPPGEPNEVVEVYLPREVEWTAKELTVTGAFKLINNTNNGLFYMIEAYEAK